MDNGPASNLPRNSFGSQAILDACWSPKELRGRDEDKVVIRPSIPAFRNPPDRTTPKQINPPLGEELEGSIRCVKPAGNRKIVALTFDLCERTREVLGYDSSIINYTG
jgi:hypothetical protein